MFCYVKHCRFSDSHTTRNHRCGICNITGHGERECNNHFAINKLKLHWSMNSELPISKQCTFAGCKTSKYHTNDAHHCEVCKKRYHSIETCSLSLSKSSNLEKKIKCICPLCKTDNEFLSSSIVYGAENICCICLTNNAIYYFPSCKHLCVCKSCIYNINENSNNYYDEERMQEKNYNIEKIKLLLKDYPSYIYIYNNINNEYILIRRLNKDSLLEGYIYSPRSLEIESILKNFINGYAKIYHDNNNLFS